VSGMTVTLFGVTVALAKFVNSVGLVLDITGVVLLFKFGLPAEISRTGAIHIITEQHDEDEVRKARKYDRLGRFGLGLLVAGFTLQLASNFF